ncbi:putative quinol monooxygenase [Yoonia sp. 208BN28-4]|uniref:putative quinol monooxygenase n=1 Tax=Yoonia sp. 208BN28-4 TaxID=3126505 RepID=UPI0030A4A2D0
MFAVTVRFDIAADQVDAFHAAMIENAATSLRVEQGCQRFDVCFNDDTPAQVFLYEVYDDPAAFAAHLDSAHFKSFDQMVAPMILKKDVATFTRVIA